MFHKVKEEIFYIISENIYKTQSLNHYFPDIYCLTYLLKTQKVISLSNYCHIDLYQIHLGVAIKTDLTLFIINCIFRNF